jgi:hypothetical protein
LTQWRRKIRTTLRQDILERREIIKIFLRVAGIAPKIEPEILASSDRDFKTKFNSHNFSGVTIFHQERESYGTRRVFTFVEYSKIGLAKSHVRHNITLYIKFLHRNILARIYLTVQSHQTRYTQYGHTQQ